MRQGKFKQWIMAASVRALKTFAQAALATIGTTAQYCNEVNWTMVLEAACLAAILSMLTSIVTKLPEVEEKP